MGSNKKQKSRNRWGHCILNFRSFSRFLLVSLTLLGLSISSASAYSIIGDFSGIRDLDIDGVNYDVDFLWGSLESLTYPEQSLFWGNKADAIIASNSVSDALTENNAQYVLRPSTGRQYLCSLFARADY